MSLVSRFLKAINGSGNKIKITPEPPPKKQTFSLPTVRFDPSRVTDAVKSDLKQNIKLIKEFNKTHYEPVYGAALRSISVGGDLGSLSKAIQEMGITGMTKGRAGEISRLLNKKAAAMMQTQGMMSLGITHAIWMYSGAGCVRDPRNPSPEEQAREAAHIAADGQRYEVEKRMFLNGTWTHPGREDGCKCVSRAVIPGLS